MAWKPLQRATPIRDEKRLAALVRELTAEGHDEATVRRLYEEGLQRECWKNLDVQVSVWRDGDTVHLSFHRLDRKPIRDWRVMQRIKNEILGPECEAVELFPAESRLADTANEYHLWGTSNPTYRFPFGFNDGRLVKSGADPDTGAVQRPLTTEKDNDDDLERES